MVLKEALVIFRCKFKRVLRILSPMIYNGKENLQIIFEAVCLPFNQGISKL